MTPTTGIMAVFAKAPIPGQVKTRMIPRLNAEQACQLHQTLIQHTIDSVINSSISDLTLWVGSHLEHEFFCCLKNKYALNMALQQGENLGARMYHAAKESLKRHPFVIIIGTDCPFITQFHVQTVANLLMQGQDCVIIPAHDGGYVLIGLSQVDERLFSDIAWGEESVFAHTKKRLNQLYYSTTVLEPLHDIDRPNDLILLEKVGINIPQ